MNWSSAVRHRCRRGRSRCTRGWCRRRPPDLRDKEILNERAEQGHHHVRRHGGNPHPAEVASMNMGTMNFGLFPMLERFKEFRFDWERPYLEGSKDLIFRNTYGDLEAVFEELGPNRTRYEFECYDTAHLYNLRHFADRGL